MVYVMSDLHGCYDAYVKILKKISFSKEDILYILGDVVDRGPNGMKILLDILLYVSMRSNCSIRVGLYEIGI